MSWQGSCDIPADARPSDVDAALAGLVVNEGHPVSPETEEAVCGAKECAKQLLYSDAFGPLPRMFGCGYRVVISGHTNPGHRPASGWSNDIVTVTVIQGSAQ